MHDIYIYNYIIIFTHYIEHNIHIYIASTVIFSVSEND